MLIEARGAVDHGDWLPWLEANFGSSERTAQNSMNAAHFAAKYETVADLKLRPSALYLLGSSKLDGELFSPTAIEAILAAAETEWVDDQRAYDIAYSVLPDPDPEPEKAEEDPAWGERQREHDERQRAQEERQREEAAENDAILDGPPPELPPAPKPAAADVVLPQFDKAMAMLAAVQTKPLASFIGTAHAPDRIAGVAAFLQSTVYSDSGVIGGGAGDFGVWWRSRTALITPPGHLATETCEGGHNCPPATLPPIRYRKTSLSGRNSSSATPTARPRGGIPTRCRPRSWGGCIRSARSWRSFGRNAWTAVVGCNPRSGAVRRRLARYGRIGWGQIPFTAPGARK